jgi:hypothetical protein
MWDPEILCENNMNIENASLHSLRTVAGFTPGGQWKKADKKKGQLKNILTDIFEQNTVGILT